MSLRMPALRAAHGAMPMEFLSQYGLAPAVVEALQARYGPTLLPVQEQAVRDGGLFEGHNLVIHSPTSSGKTLVAELACLRAVSRDTTALYVTPTKALANEKTAHLRQTYGDLGFRVIASTGDRRADDERLTTGRFHLGVVVYEKLLGLLADRPGLLGHVGVVVLDEVQLLFDEERGPRAELLLLRLRAAADLQLVALSALACGEHLAGWLGARTIRDDRRPVSLRQGVLHRGVFHYRDQATGDEGEEALSGGEGDDREVILSAALSLARRGEQTLVFLPTRFQVNEWALWAAETRPLPAAGKALRALEEHADGAGTRLLRCLLRAGMAAHHSDLLPAQRALVERAVLDGEVALLFATSTLAEGVNLPTVNTLVFREMLTGSVEDMTQGRPPQPTRISPARFHNMTGRSGRLGMAGGATPPFGRGILVAEDEADIGAMFQHYLLDPVEACEPVLWRRPLEQALATCLTDGAVQTLEQLTGMLRETLSAHCGLWSLTVPEIHQAAARLCALGLATQDGERLALTATGRVMGAFGLQPECVRAMDAALDWLAERGDALEALALLAGTPEGAMAYLPLSRAEREQRLPLHWLEQLARQRECADCPALAALLSAECLLPETMASAKKTLALALWLSDEPTPAVEQRFRVMSGALSKLSERFSWLAQAWAALAELRGKPPAVCRRLERLAAALGADVPFSALGLAPLADLDLDRSHFLLLVAHGIRTLADLEGQGEAALPRKLPKSLRVKVMEHILRRKRRPGRRGAALFTPCEPDVPQIADVQKPRHTDNAGGIPLTFDPEDNQLLHVGDVTVACTPTERRLVECVARATSTALRWDAVMDDLWGRRAVSQECVYRHKSNLNRKVREATGGVVEQLLVTVPRRGLKLGEGLAYGPPGSNAGPSG